MRTTWPLDRSKPEYIRRSGAGTLLLPNGNYVLLRRFSAKEEPRGLTAAPWLASEFAVPEVGIENHLNYVHRPGGMLSEDEAWGLAALYNSRLLDTWFRAVSGNTQVSATELRAMPHPAHGTIIALGQRVKRLADSMEGIDALVMDMVARPGPKEAAVEEAREILEALGMPPPQRNEMSGMTLIALCGLTPDAEWSAAERRSCTVTKGIMDYLKEHYGADYAPNTRETFRRQVPHQFVQGRIADYNPFEPNLPTNSPRAHYAITEAALEAVRCYGTDEWNAAAARFRRERSTLSERYEREREHNLVPVTLPGGRELRLSPGRHNEVQKAVVEQFAPRFAPGARLLYLGDTARKNLLVDGTGLTGLDIPFTDHDKLPDVMLHDIGRNWLFLVEAVTSHGPMTPKRIVELEEILSACPAAAIYVSAFPDFGEFQKHMKAIA